MEREPWSHRLHEVTREAVVCGTTVSRGERHSEVSYELATRSRHSQRNLAF
jgi:hypothetical protein